MDSEHLQTLSKYERQKVIALLDRTDLKWWHVSKPALSVAYPTNFPQQWIRYCNRIFKKLQLGVQCKLTSDDLFEYVIIDEHKWLLTKIKYVI